MKIKVLVYSILIIVSCNKKDEQQVAVANSREVINDSQNSIAPLTLSNVNVHGIWKVTSVEGNLYVKVGDNAPEVEAPIDIWVGKTFEFGSNGLMKIGGMEGEVLSSEYSVSSNEITVPKYGGKYAMKVEVEGNTMRLIQTPDNYYAMLSEESKIPETQVRKQFRVPGNIIMKLEKQ